MFHTGVIQMKFYENSRSGLLCKSIATAFLSLILIAGCGSQDDGPLLQSSYTGTLGLSITNAFPPFDAFTQVNVEIDINGHVTIGTGTLAYDGEGIHESGDSKIRRSGTLNLAPSGTIAPSGDDFIVSILENTSYDETFQQWVWDDDNKVWIDALDYEVSGTWNEGLGFSLQDAQLSGSTVGVFNGQGVITWRLSLTPALVE